MKKRRVGLLTFSDGRRFAHEMQEDMNCDFQARFRARLESTGEYEVVVGEEIVWHPDTSALTKIRMAIVAEPEQWAKARRKLELEGDSLMRPPRGFDPNHRFIEDIKRKDFVASVALAEAQVCGPKFMRDFTAVCRTMLPLVEFTTTALGCSLRRCRLSAHATPHPCFQALRHGIVLRQYSPHRRFLWKGLGKGAKSLLCRRLPPSVVPGSKQ